MSSQSCIHLDFSGDYFGGREKELETLRSSLNLERSESSRCRIFFIQGEPGVGKSCLVEQAFRNSGSASLILAKAKFDDSYATTPLHVWIEATESILAEAETDSNFRAHLYKSFQLSSEQAADYLSVLTAVWGGRLRKLFEDRPENASAVVMPKRAHPSFQALAPRDSNGSLNFDTVGGLGASVARSSVVMTARTSIAEKNYSFERLKLAYRELYRVVCKYTNVVLFMDDVQWGEPDDFEMMETLLDDQELRERLIFVAAHRPVAILHGLNLVKNPRKRYSKTITLSPLNSCEVAQMLSKLLLRTEEDLGDVAEVMEQISGGNPFFLRQLVQLFYDQEHIQYSVSHKRWEWNMEGIRLETAIGDNVFEVVAKKIAQRGHLVKILGLGAFLGSSRISVSDLTWLLEQETDEVQSKHFLQTHLQEAVEMGWIDRIDPREYRFAHDLIRESALALLSKGESIEKIHMQIGLRLRSSWERNPMDDRCLFQVVTQLNAGKSLIKTAKERLRLAQLNFHAAEAAIERAAFYPAVHFLRRTKELLGEEGYEVDVFDFALKTEIALARMEFCCGLLDRSITRADAVLTTARTDKERAEAMHLKVKCFIKQKHPLKSLDVAYAALSSFGLFYPQKFVNIHVHRLHKTCKMLLKNLSDDDIMNLPCLEEDRDQLASECLSWIGEISLTYNGYEDHFSCCMLTGMVLSIKKGRNPMTGQALASWGAMLSENGQIAEAYRYGRLAIEIADDRIGGILDDRVPSLYYSSIYHLRHPYIDGVEPFSKAIKRLWARGCLEGVVWDTRGYHRLYYLAGLKLRRLLDEMRHHRSLCDDFEMVTVRSLLDPFAQMIHNLVEGPCEHMLRGEFMVETKSIKFWQQSKCKIGIQLYYFHKMIAAYYFNSYDLAGKLASKVTEMYIEGADNFTPYRFFFRGLAAWTAYGITQRSHYLKLARKMTEGVEMFVNAGVINCKHSLLFLQAESAGAFCTKGRNRQAVQNAFDDAIAAATQGGFVYDQALANERAGRYFMKLNDQKMASTYVKTALDCYRAWEADAKAQQMLRAYGTILV